MSLRLQDQAVLQYLEMIGAKRRTGRGDVDDQLCGACCWRGFGGANAFHYAIAGDAARGKEATRQIHIFGGDAEAAAVRTGELRGDILEISHPRDVDPAVRDRHHYVRATKAEGGKKLDRAIDIGERLADQVLAGNAGLDAACFSLVHDLCRREIDHLDAIEAFEPASVKAVVACFAQGEACPLEQICGLILEPALRGDGDRQFRAGHHAPLSTPASIRSVWMADPIPG